MGILELLKHLLAKKYNMKYLNKVKTIIGWQVIKNSIIGTMKIDKSTFIRDLVIEKDLTNCNTLVISIKAKSSIKMLDPNDYNETNLHKY